MMSDLFKHRHAKLGCMVLRLFPRVMQTVLKYYFTTQGLRKKYLQTDFRFVFTQNESVLMNMLPNMDEFTIEICYKILRFEKMLDEPMCKWGNSPHDTEIGIADDIQRLIQATNSIIGKKSEEVTEHIAEKLLEEIKLMVTRIDSFLEQDTLGSMYNNLCRSETDCISILQDLTRVKVIEESLTNTESEKRERYSRLSIPIIETFPNILRNVIGQIIPVIKLYHMCALDLKTFYPEQQANIQELQNSNTYNSLDVTLIYQLLRQFKLIQPPQKGWGSIPDKVDIQLGDDVERIRYYRNKLAHRRDTKVDKKEFNEYFDEFREIGYRMDQKSLQPTNYEQEISGYRTCVMDTAMQAKYENALKEIENIKLRYEKRPIRVYWGVSFERSLMDLRSLLKDAKLEGREKVRVQIVFQNEADIESNAEVLNSLKKEINEGLIGIELIGATKGSLVLHVDILMEMLETDEQLLTTLALFFKKIMERITIFPTETIDFTLFPVEDNLTEHTQWNKQKNIGEQVYLEFDIEAQLLETDEKMVEQLTKISDAILKHSNGSGTNQNITATLLPIDLENMSNNEKAQAATQTQMENISTTELSACDQEHDYITDVPNRIRCARCSMVVFDVFSKIMQDLMEQTGTPAKALFNDITRNAHFRRRLNKNEFDMVRTLLTNEYTKIDTNLSYKIIVNFFQLSIPPPSRKWGAHPKDTEIGIGEDIERIRQARNSFVHRLDSYIPEHMFDNFFATFIEVGKRVDAFLNKSPNNGYEHAVRQRKICVIDSETEKKLLDAQSDIEQMIDKYRFAIGMQEKEIHVFAGKSSTAAIEKIRAEEDLEESFTKLKIIIPEVDDSEEAVKLINSLKENINSDNIYLKGAEKGSIIIFFDVKNRVVLDDSMFKFEVSTFIQKLFKFCNLTCYLHTHTYAIMASATEIFEQPTINLPDKAKGKCFLDEKSPVDVKFEVNNKIFHSPDRLNGTLNRVFKIVVIKGNGKNLLGKGDEELGESENISTTKAFAQSKDLMEMYQPQKKLISNLRNFSNTTSPFLSIYVNA